MDQLERELLAGYRPSVRAQLERAANYVKTMRTPKDVEKVRAFINRSTSLPDKSKSILQGMMNQKIMSLMQNPDFAYQVSGRFVDDNVYGSGAKEKISLLRLQALEKRMGK